MIIRVHGPYDTHAHGWRIHYGGAYYRAECCGALAVGATRDAVVHEMRWRLKDPGRIPVLYFPAGVRP